jgi:hypothetical protein
MPVPGLVPGTASIKFGAGLVPGTASVMFGAGLVPGTASVISGFGTTETTRHGWARKRQPTRP